MSKNWLEESKFTKIIQRGSQHGIKVLVMRQALVKQLNPHLGCQLPNWGHLGQFPALAPAPASYQHTPLGAIVIGHPPPTWEIQIGSLGNEYSVFLFLSHFHSLSNTVNFLKC